MAKFINVISHQSMTKINIYHYNYQGNVRKYKQYQIHDMYSHGSSNTVIRRDDTCQINIYQHAFISFIAPCLTISNCLQDFNIAHCKMENKELQCNARTFKPCDLL